MSPTASAILRSWTFDAWSVAPILLVLTLYLRGWLGLHRRQPRRFTRARAAVFAAGALILVLAVCSPIDVLGSMLLQAHMAQHILVMMAAPPLLLWAWPALPVLCGLPRRLRREWIGPFLASPAVRRATAFATHPITCFAGYTIILWTWHHPGLYELALRSEAWHRVEHLSFFLAGVLLWWPVIQPYPFRAAWPRWAAVPYLVVATVENTIFSALFAFSDRVFYPAYEQAPRLGWWSALDDQAAAGAMMWVPGSLIMLVPIVWLLHELTRSTRLRAVGPVKGLALAGVGGFELEGGSPSPATSMRTGQPENHSRTPVIARSAGVYVSNGGALALPVLPATGPSPATHRGDRREHHGFDLLRVPFVGAALRRSGVRLALRTGSLLIAIAIVLDGLLGPPVEGMNGAGVIPWIHWRGMVVIGLLALGNLFCPVCPFILPRRLARRFKPVSRDWPRALRSKWFAVALVTAFLVAYELFSLWSSPWWTAWIIVGYFVVALGVDTLFRGDAFCRYLCPIGQFQVVHSALSPLEVRVRDQAVCTSCASRACTRGAGRSTGCGMGLNVPAKVGNTDCTFCLECVSACPHDNIGLLPRMPGEELILNARPAAPRSLARRPDLAALLVVFAFGAFANAAGMVAPVLAWQDGMVARLGIERWMVVLASLALSIVVTPTLLVLIAGVLGAAWTGLTARRVELTCRMTASLVPIGFAMWFSHMVFHFVTSAGSIVPVTQRVLGDLGATWAGSPAWQMACCTTFPAWLLPLELTMLGAGLVVGVTVAWRLALEAGGSVSAGIRIAPPWFVINGLLYAVGAWILFQPMEMRGLLDG